MKRPHPDSERLAEIVKASRKQARLSQERLAELASISRRPLYLFESGKGDIQLGTLLKILDALGLEIDVRPRRPLD
ncbi:MAG: helix-turn-helix domain-containing protein [Fimbriimonadales bacterium]